MRLHIGVMSDSSGWQQLLSQEGISYSKITGDFDTDGYSAVVAGREHDPGSIDQVRRFLNNGGAVLCSGKFFSQLTDNIARQEYVKYLYPHQETIFRNTEIIDVGKECWIPGQANQLLTDSGRQSVYVGKFGNGEVIVLPFDAGELVLDERVATKSFYAGRSRLPFEQVSLVSKNGIRRLVSQSLEILHHKRGFPYVHRWYYPRDAKNIFVFRIDTDKGSREEIKNLNRFISEDSTIKIHASWFVDVKSQEQWLAEYAMMNGQEIGVHCYEHKRYDDLHSASEDIAKAVSSMRNASIHTGGFASPYGNWNSGICEAVERQGFDYSSEFSYDYDNVPSFPYMNERYSGVLQVPVHPVSIGSLRRQGFSENEMKQYFKYIFEKKVSASEPLFFYHHPKDHGEPVLEEIFEWARHHGIQNMTMGDYARWWKQRLMHQDDIQLNGSSLSMNLEKKLDDVWLRVTMPDGTETFVEPARSIALDTLQWKRLPVSHKFSIDMLRTRSYNPWVPLIRVQDKIYSFFHR